MGTDEKFEPEFVISNLDLYNLLETPSLDVPFSPPQREGTGPALLDLPSHPLTRTGRVLWTHQWREGGREGGTTTRLRRKEQHAPSEIVSGSGRGRRAQPRVPR